VGEVRPRPVQEQVQRLETPPGHQGQVDFAEFRTPWERHALVVVLGYSRLMWVRYYERQTHLAISLAITAAESGRKIYFGTLTDLVDSLEEAKAAGRLNRRLNTLTHPALLVVDEIGYLPVTQSGAILFFQLVNRRYGRGSTVLTSKEGFEEWGRILGDEVMAAALLDRLLHRCHIVNIRGNSYRMRRHAELSKSIHPLGSRVTPDMDSGEAAS